MTDSIHATIVLNDMERTREAAYGFRSWMLQDTARSYEVVLNLFNEHASLFESISAGRRPACSVRILTYKPPRFFNISAANNLGLAAAKGSYVLFANSDIIYPSWFLRLFMDEILRRDLCYVLAARRNLSLEVTAALPPAGDLASVDDLATSAGQTQGGYGSPWTVRRDVALAIGGFDARILCHEDAEFNDRAIHYLRRKELQTFIPAATDLCGYHLHHSASELYSVSRQAKAIIEPRRERLFREPGSSEDIVGTCFNDREQLLKDLYDLSGNWGGASVEPLTTL
jgi:hypothetical protein